MMGTFGGALEARQVDASNGKLTAEVTGEVETEEGVWSCAASMWPCAWWRLKEAGRPLRGHTGCTPCIARSTGHCTRRSNSLLHLNWLLQLLRLDARH